MLFNSYEFLLLFLPICLTVCFTIAGRGWKRVAMGWLIICSLYFYSWWNPKYLFLIVGSIAFNRIIGLILAERKRRWILFLGVIVNISLLGYFKYTNFMVDSINLFFGTQLHLNMIILPLAISFFTFQQISYIVDSYSGKANGYSFLEYFLFVSFFPQLIAGPIVHHSEMIPQFSKAGTFKFCNKNIAIGVTVFLFGLFKKVIVADNVAVYATPVFRAAESGELITFFEAWAGTLSYTFQLYFDFSGYSDMAIGLAKIFGIALPVNFYSPYKSRSVIDFWRRWHITLSRFLKQYLYIPLGGNQTGKTRHLSNLLITMLLGGLWHGAGWTFLFWGGLHGCYLIINHVWRSLALLEKYNNSFRNGIYRILTFLSVMSAWVFFRAESFSGAGNILKGMLGFNGFVLRDKALPMLNKIGGLGDFLIQNGWEFQKMERFDGFSEVINLLVLIVWVWFLPNTQELMNHYHPAIDQYTGDLSDSNDITKINWQPTWKWGLFVLLIGLFSFYHVNHVSEFLYFNF